MSEGNGSAALVKTRTIDEANFLGFKFVTIRFHKEGHGHGDPEEMTEPDRVQYNFWQRVHGVADDLHFLTS